MDKKYWYLLAGVLIGLIAAPQLRKIPGVSSLPVV
jgi:hypothetical protein